MSETAFFVKDVIGPKGSVSIVMAETGGPAVKSDDINTHTKTNQILYTTPPCARRRARQARRAAVDARRARP